MTKPWRNYCLLLSTVYINLPSPHLIENSLSTSRYRFYGPLQWVTASHNGSWFLHLLCYLKNLMRHWLICYRRCSEESRARVAAARLCLQTHQSRFSHLNRWIVISIWNLNPIIQHNCQLFGKTIRTYVILRHANTRIDCILTFFKRKVYTSIR